MGGIAFTSSHGTGKHCTVASDLLIAATVVCANGEIVEISPQKCEIVNGDKRSNATFLLSKNGNELKPEDIWRAFQVNLGAFGMVYDMTIIVKPRIYAHFVTEPAKWEKYFGTEENCAENLSKLNKEWDTLEFWHWPLTFEELYNPSVSQLLTGNVTYNPYVVVTKTMSNNISEEQSRLYDVVEKDMNSIELVSQLAFQCLGSRFASKLWK